MQLNYLCIYHTPIIGLPIHRTSAQKRPISAELVQMKNYGEQNLTFGPHNKVEWHNHNGPCTNTHTNTYKHILVCKRVCGWPQMSTAKNDGQQTEMLIKIGA